MSWKDQLRADPLPWLLEPEDPGVRYLALRDLLDLPADSAELAEARLAAYRQGPIAAYLDAMDPGGFWIRMNAGYNPKYRSAVWSLMALGQLGASAACDERIGVACALYFEKGLTQAGQCTESGAPSGTIDCLQGDMCAAFLELGYQDPRLDKAFEWMARTVTGEGIAPASQTDAPLRYYSYKCGPLFACGANGKKGCGWGAVKVMLAFSKLPVERSTPLIQRAIDQGVDFLFSVDPATAAYPTRHDEKPSRNWWKFGFPVFYVTDLLQNVEALARLGYGSDPRLANSLELIRQKQDEQGRWALEYDYTDKTWSDFGTPKQPNKWVTLRALHTLKLAAETAPRHP